MIDESLESGALRRKIKRQMQADASSTGDGDA